MTSCSGSDRTPSAFDLRELDKFRRLENHREIATARAMDYCATNQICPPEWLVVEAASLMVELLKREKSTKRGSTSGHLARFHQELKNTERWFAVKEVQRIREMAEQDDNALKANPKRVLPKNFRAQHMRRRAWLDQGTFECAADLLEGRDAYVSCHGVRSSYMEVEKCRKSPSYNVGAWFDDAFLNKLGLQGALDRKPGKKVFLFLT
jgi:hypothetical protein